ncbi:ABC transporter substrate-binding protein [Halobacteriales archaeon QH_2_65_14]|nr:MAG: ABC transporter substrate-binding protein [Halobacteriales archaeon QH_2_65_14]
MDDGDDSDPQGPDISEGGRLEFAIEREGIGNYDTADSSLADDTTIFNVVYDGLLSTNQEGENFNWMAQRYETTDAQDVGPADYAPYMREEEIADVSDTSVALFDLEWPNRVIVRHPDDVAAVRNGDLEAGDTMRVLTREETGDAVDDGVYGTRIEGELHEGIEFHNGTECTAENVVRSYDRLVDSNNAGQQFASFLHARTSDGPDGYTFELYAVEPDAIAELDLLPFSIYPDEHLDIEPGGLDPRDGGEVPIGTGPYEIAEFSEGSELLLQKTDNYWLEDLGLDSKEWWDGPDWMPEGPVVDEINVRFVPEAGTRVAGLQDGTIDIAYQLEAGDRTAFDQNDDFTVGAAVSTGFLFMQFPIVEGTDLGNAEVRQAIQNLIPRQDIVEIVAEGWGAPAQVPFPAPVAGLASQMSYDEIQEEDWAYPKNPQPDVAEQLINETDLEPPIPFTVDTNADDSERQDKMQILVDELNQSGLFDANLETPADIQNWFAQTLIAPDSTQQYADRNAVAVIGLAAGFDPHAYPEALHHPDNFNGCCNFFHGEGTFDWIDLLDSCRFGVDVAQDPDLRRDRYDQLWPQLVEDVGNTMVDFSLETAVAGPDVEGYDAYPSRTGFLSYSLFAPYDEQISWLNR